MLVISEPPRNTYGYRFDEGPKNEVAQIWSIGWQEQTTCDYRWNGINRKEDGKYIFQYTLSGSGVIEINGNPFRVEPEYAFLVEIPGDHCYFVPEDGGRWEFVFINLNGSEVQEVWRDITSRCGAIVRFQPQSTLIQTLLKIYKMACEGNIMDGYRASSLAFEFIMELYRAYAAPMIPKENWPMAITKAVTFVQGNYSKPISVEDMASAAGLSVYRFTHLFTGTLGSSPVEYLTKIRVEKAAEFLRKTSNSIEEVARSVGYSNGNYFCKVFKRLVGSTPGSYRNDDVFPVDYLFVGGKGKDDDVLPTE